jgi:hypothetical protein
VYCGDPCRRHDLNHSIVMRVYRASETAAEARGFVAFADFDRTTHDEYRSRIAAAVKDEA